MAESESAVAAPALMSLFGTGFGQNNQQQQQQPNAFGQPSAFGTSGQSTLLPCARATLTLSAQVLARLARMFSSRSSKLHSSHRLIPCSET